jgi:release factor glutamine methyltransferase
MSTKKRISQPTISQLTKESVKSVDIHELQILTAHVLDKSKEFVLAHPEFELTQTQAKKIKKALTRRTTGEPIAYITGHKEFYNMDFIVNKHTLIPRPETELMVELTITNIQRATNNKRYTIMDVGTGSGNIIISLAHKLNKPICNFLGIDISKDALKIARKNAKINNVDKKIKFIHGNLLSKFSNATMQPCDNLIILANLPYLSKEIYGSTPEDVKKFEPKSALYSPEKGLSHYKKLLHQLKSISTSCLSCVDKQSSQEVNVDRSKAISCLLEISPEQKPLLSSLVEKIFPKAKTRFHKDLAGRWRVCEIHIR